jgi:hypothetical protein
MRSPVPLLLARILIPEDSRLFNTSDSPDPSAAMEFDRWLVKMDRTKSSKLTGEK